MAQKQYLLQQSILVDPIHTLHPMGVMWVVMVEIIQVMCGVVVGLGHQLDMVVIAVGMVDLLQSPQLR